MVLTRIKRFIGTKVRGKRERDRKGERETPKNLGIEILSYLKINTNVK